MLSSREQKKMHKIRQISFLMATLFFSLYLGPAFGETQYILFQKSNCEKRLSYPLFGEIRSLIALKKFKEISPLFENQLPFLDEGEIKNILSYLKDHKVELKLSFKWFKVLFDPNQIQLHAVPHIALRPHDRSDQKILTTLLSSAHNNALQHVRSMDLSTLKIDSNLMMKIVYSPHFINLQSLNIAFSKVDSHSIEILGYSKNFSLLTHLDLSHSKLGSKGLKQLINTPLFPRLHGLSLDYSGIDSDGIDALAYDSPLNTNLQELTLSGNRIGLLGAIALGESPFLSQLRVLDLSNNDATYDALYELAKSPYLTKLETLNLSDNRGLNYQETEALKKLPFFQKIRHLIF
jgi:hypothetical protein